MPTDLKTQIQTFADLGVEVAITELDIRMTLPATDELLAQQKTDYENVVAACMDVDGCVGITIWDYTVRFCFVALVCFNGTDVSAWVCRISTLGCHQLSLALALRAPGTRYAAVFYRSYLFLHTRFLPGCSRSPL